MCPLGTRCLSARALAPGLLESFHSAQRAGDPRTLAPSLSRRTAPVHWRPCVWPTCGRGAWPWASRVDRRALALCRAQRAQGRKGAGSLGLGPCSCSAFFPSTSRCFWGAGGAASFVLPEKTDREGAGREVSSHSVVFSLKPQNVRGHWRC